MLLILDVSVCLVNIVLPFVAQLSSVSVKGMMKYRPLLLYHCP